MLVLVVSAYWKLIYFEKFLAHKDLPGLYGAVRHSPYTDGHASDDVIAKICAAVDIACVWYWKQVLCLQRSAVTACLLKAHGVPAQMVIGAQQLPFKAHAWVKVDGRVVNDKPYVPEIYAILDRC